MVHTDVLAQVERRCVCPQRAAEASPGYVQDLMEPREEVQPIFDDLLRGLDPEATLGVEQAAAVEQNQSTDVLRPNLIRPQDKPVLRGQPLN